MAKAFFDTNILVYAFAQEHRTAVARALLSAGGDISVQVLNEFANVARRKQGLGWAEVEQALEAVRKLLPTIHPIDIETHIEALALGRRYNLALYDALIVASAKRARCAILYSGDMHDGLAIEDGPRIVNPFAGAPNQPT